MPGPFISLYSLSRSQNIRIGGGPSSAALTGLNALFAPTGFSATVASGGALTANTYFYKITATRGGGETTASAERSATTSGGNLTINLAWTAVPGATGYNIYRATSSNAEVLIASVSGTATSYADVGGQTVGTATPPTTNTSAQAGRLVPQLTQNPSTGPVPYPLVVDLSDPQVRRDLGHHISEGNLVEVSGVRYTVSLPSSVVLSTASTETLLLSIPIQPNLFTVGSQVRFGAQGVYVGTTSPSVALTARVGTTGSLSDTLVCATGAATTATGTGFDLNALLTCQAVGSGTTGKILGNAQAVGHGNFGAFSAVTTAVNVDTTLPLYVTFSITAVGSGLTVTTTNAVAEFMQASTTFPC